MANQYLGKSKVVILVKFLDMKSRGKITFLVANKANIIQRIWSACMSCVIETLFSRNALTSEIIIENKTNENIRNNTAPFLFGC
jgi:hypothetical protein